MNHSGPPDTDTKAVAAAPAKKPDTLRDKIVRATPAFIVNSSSNVIGAMHIVAEVLMLKASGVMFWRNVRTPLAKEILPQIDKLEGQRRSLMKAADSTEKYAELLASGKVSALEKEIVSLNAPLTKEVSPLIDPANNLWRAITGKDKDALLQNHWSTRATTSGFFAWVLGSILPDRSDNVEQNQTDEQLLNDSRVKYAGRRMFEAVQIGNPDTKRQQIGLGVTMAGLFSAISGFNNVNLKTGVRVTNWAHALGGLITALSGANLLFAKTDRDGWKGFGSTLWLRLPLAGMAVHRKYTSHDRWLPYLGGQVMFQSAALYAYLFGGIEKLPDGTIVETKNSHHATQVATASVPKVEVKVKKELSRGGADTALAQGETFVAPVPDVSADDAFSVNTPSTKVSAGISDQRVATHEEHVQHVAG